MASVKVAVRVRPFNKREKDMKTQQIIAMEGKSTRITNVKLTEGKVGDIGRERNKDFTFDYSYWSLNEKDENFVSQEQVFKDLGLDVVNSAFEGYNACVFAYGQTGSGKTYTMMGSKKSLGLIPRICMALFRRMKEEGKENNRTYRTEVSYLEIYNEQVRDLLHKDQSHNLKVREHKTLGPYVEDLSQHLVMEYRDIETLMNTGNRSRTTASTKMNDVSSRSHAIVTITFVQAKFIDDMPSETVSKVHLVDLAGSERADTSGASGQRLKEGAHINKSLVTLGLVISALSEKSSVKSSTSAFIPYRDSVLTWLLKDSLGGNSKTIMVAAISPAACNYAETLSTLRYANRAKNIVNKPTINEDENVKLIRELRAEITRLRHCLPSNTSAAIQPQMLEKIQQKEAQEKVLTDEWNEKWRETQKILKEQKALALRKAGQGVVLDCDMPHLIGIDDDVRSTGITLYHLKEGVTTIGSENSDIKPDIILNSDDIEENHCNVVLENGVATLNPTGQAQCFVNSEIVDKPTKLSQGCIILLGSSMMFRYNDPAEAAKLRRDGTANRGNMKRSFLSQSTTDLARSTENLLNIPMVEDDSTVAARQLLVAEKSQLDMQREQWRAEQLKQHQQNQLAKEEIIEQQKFIEQERQQLSAKSAIQRKIIEEDWQNLLKHERQAHRLMHMKEMEIEDKRIVLNKELTGNMLEVVHQTAEVLNLRTTLDASQKINTEFLDQLAVLWCESGLITPNQALSFMNLTQQGLENFFARRKEEIEQSMEDALSEVRAKLQELEEIKLSGTSEEAIVEIDKNCKILAEEEKETESTFEKKLQDLDEKRLTFLETKAIALKQGETLSELETEIQHKLDELSERHNKISEIQAELSHLELRKKVGLEVKAELQLRKDKLTLDLNAVDFPTDEVGKIPSPTNTPTGGKYDSKANDDEKSGTDFRSNNSSTELLSEDGEGAKSLFKDKTKFYLVSGQSNDTNSNSPMIPELNMTASEAVILMKNLSRDIYSQDMILLDCLDNDCNKAEFDKQMQILRASREKYAKVSRVLGKKRWRKFRDAVFDELKEHDVVVHDNHCDSEETYETEERNMMDVAIAATYSYDYEYLFPDWLKRFKNSQLPGKCSVDDKMRSMPTLTHIGDSSESPDEDNSAPMSPRSMNLPLSRSSLCSSNRTVAGEDEGLIVTIPSYVMRGNGSSAHFEYEVNVSVEGERWKILRRFRRFRELHNQMKAKCGSEFEKLVFPSRKLFGQRSESVARERRLQLEQYLQDLVKFCEPTKENLFAFSSFFKKGMFESSKHGTC